jgi:polyisoprenoid-binding protein YceI
MFRRIFALAAAVGVSLAAASPLAAQAVPRPSSRPAPTGTRWIVDPVHSQVDFQVRHLVGRVRGTFDDWYGVLVTKDQDWTRGTVNVTAQTRTLNTGNQLRDADLRSDRFFATDSFPQLSFESPGILATDSTVQIGGILTIKGHSRHVVLTGQYRGIAQDGDGHQRIAFDASTVVDRRDFGITWNETVGGTDLIGNEVTITIAIEAVRVS